MEEKNTQLKLEKNSNQKLERNKHDIKLQNAIKYVLRGKFIALQEYIEIYIKNYVLISKH